jgi:protein phosphatase
VTQSDTLPLPAPTEAQSSQSTGVHVKLFARTDVGQVRDHNEDNFLVADLTRRSRGLLEANRTTHLGPQGAIFAVCDGMGGAAAGEIASQLAVDTVYEHMAESVSDRPPTRDEIALRLVHAVEAAGQRIFHEARIDRSRRGMGTTITAAALVDATLFFAQVGDSRGYILRGGKLVQLTRDQSLVNQLIEAGQLTEEEAENFEHNNIIWQALGTSETVQVDLTYAELRKGDTLLLCSDGLSGMLHFEEICKVIRAGIEPLDICKSLTDRANAAGGHDNITVIVAQFDGERLQPFDPTADPKQLTYSRYDLGNVSVNVMPAMPTQNAQNSGGNLVTRTDPYLAPSPHPPPWTGVTPSNWQEQEGQPGDQYGAQHGDGGNESGEYDDRVTIPNAHVPIWMVAVIVLGAIVLLVGAALLLAR